MTAKEKMTAPIASVSADVEQPSSNKLTKAVRIFISLQNQNRSMTDWKDSL